MNEQHREKGRTSERERREAPLLSLPLLFVLPSPPRCASPLSVLPGLIFFLNCDMATHRPQGSSGRIDDQQSGSTARRPLRSQWCRANRIESNEEWRCSQQAPDECAVECGWTRCCAVRCSAVSTAVQRPSASDSSFVSRFFRSAAGDPRPTRSLTNHNACLQLCTCQQIGIGKCWLVDISSLS